MSDATEMMLAQALDGMLSWALSNRGTPGEFVTCYTYKHGEIPPEIRAAQRALAKVRPAATTEKHLLALKAARYFGAEYAANPGSSKSEYLESLALKSGVRKWGDIPLYQRNALEIEFRAGQRDEEKAIRSR